MRTSEARVIAKDVNTVYSEAEIFQAIITLDLGVKNAKETAIELADLVQTLKARVLAGFEPVVDPVE